MRRVQSAIRLGEITILFAFDALSADIGV